MYFPVSEIAIQHSINPLLLQLPCFNNSSGTIQAMKGRFDFHVLWVKLMLHNHRFHMNLTEDQLHALVDAMVEQSLNSITTK